MPWHITVAVFGEGEKTYPTILCFESRNNILHLESNHDTWDVEIGSEDTVTVRPATEQFRRP
jgi:hypothetical protein